ncbi:restriction endonuclease subunit S [Vibrio cholerae]|nr:restriction endonuclease subunit S [Vibrio cholerae]EHY0935728.1 restriction endonuclease subunit S [Vibrio cholerae]
MPQRTSIRALSDIADLRTGFTFRGKIEEVDKEAGNAHVAQIKDVREAWETSNLFTLQASQMPLIKWTGKSNAFVSPGTVLLPARGSRGGYFRASCLVADERSSKPVVVSSQFVVITPKADVIPEFLCWSLNQPAVQYWLSEGTGSQGSNIVMLNTKVVGELKLDIPPIATQQKILHINTLWEQEQHLTKALLKNREIMLQGMFQQMIKGTHS